MAAILCLALLMSAAPAQQSDAGAGAMEVIEPLMPGLWVIRQREPFHLQPVGNVLLIEQASGLVLIDGGGSPGSARRIAALIRSRTSKPVTAIAITHWHGDHALGVATLLQQWPGARVLATSATRAHLLGASMQHYPKGAADPARTRAFLDSIAPAIKSFKEAASDRSLAPELRAGYAASLRDLDLYQRDIQGVFLPARIEAFEQQLALADPERPVQLRFLGRGNTDGDLVAWLPRQGVLESGDLVVAPIPFGFNSYPGPWQATLGKLLDLRPRIIVPGHGRPMQGTAYVRQLHEMLAGLRQRMTVLGPLPDRAQAAAALAPSFEPYLQQFAGRDPWLQHWFHRYWQEPISEVLWKESRGMPIEQGEG